VVTNKPIVIDQSCGLIEKSNAVQLGFEDCVSRMRALRQSLAFMIRLASLGSRHFPRGNPGCHCVDIFKSRCASFHEMSPQGRVA